MNFDAVRTIATALPGVEESTSYGTPAFKVRGKLIARLWEDGSTLVIRAQWEERERLLRVHPDVYFLTDHYRGHPWVLARLDPIPPGFLALNLLHAWQQAAPKSLLRQR